MRIRGFLLWLILSTSAYGQEQNQLTNPGFEIADEYDFALDWKGDKDVYSRDISVVRSGEASLKCSNSNPDYYMTCVQNIDFEIGRSYEFDVWIKTQGVTGSSTGATICVQWFDAKGSFISGSYTAGVKGDSDWTKINGITQPMPKNAARCSVECFLSKEMTGTAWFDDVTIQPILIDPLKTVLKKPNYRGEVYVGSDADIEVRVSTNLADYKLSPRQVLLRWNLLEGVDGKSLVTGTKKLSDSDQTKLEIHAGKLQPGRYSIVIELIKPETNELLSSKKHSINCLQQPQKRHAYIDGHNRLIFQGKPFFPLGMYWLETNAELLDIYSQSEFNCLMPYNPPNREQMDLSSEYGLKVIYSVKDSYFGTHACVDQIKSQTDELVYIKEKVEAFKDHPALLAWYINDELGIEHLDRLTERYINMQELDPGHPTWIVLYQINQVAEYNSTFDVIGTDPYPIPNSPPSEAGEWTHKTKIAVQGARPMWQVPQMFDWVNYPENPNYPKVPEDRRPPTLEEMRSMAWQCIAEGANGLIFYSWFDLYTPIVANKFENRWQEIKTVAQEISDMIPVLLSVEPTPVIKLTQEATPDWLNWTVRQIEENTFLIAVNNTCESHELEFELPQNPQTTMLHGSQSKVMTQKRILPVVFNPLDVLIYEIKGLKQ